MTLILYGIPNCDTVKKARAWLDGRCIAYAFNNYRVDGIDRGTVSGWVKAVGLKTVLNRNSTTFRELPEAKSDLSEPAAIALMVAHPTMIKRPVLVGLATPLFGFRPDLYAAALGGP
jgi:Spx/MgsR family transcriptional regulator